MRLFILGIILTIISWIFSWTRFYTPINEVIFFPLWLGYILTINGFSEVIFHTSLLRKMRYSFLILFLISIPMWWYFEFLNQFLQNWHYISTRPVSPLEYFIRASVDFSTVVPAVLSTTFLFKRVIEIVNKCEFKKRDIRKSVLFGIIFFGIVTLIAMPFFPTILFPFAWMSAYFIIDPVNNLLGKRSLFKDYLNGNWINIFSLSLATLFTGFWWEMWNFYSLPKWYYTIPYVGFYKIFEMPILGYLGYIPFSFEIFSFTVLAFGLINLFYKKVSLPEL